MPRNELNLDIGASYLESLFPLRPFRRDGFLDGVPFMFEVALTLPEYFEELHIPKDSHLSQQKNYVAVVIDEQHRLLHSELISPDLLKEMEQETTNPKEWHHVRRQVFLRKWSSSNQKVIATELDGSIVT